MELLFCIMVPSGGGGLNSGPHVGKRVTYFLVPIISPSFYIFVCLSMPVLKLDPGIFRIGTEMEKLRGSDVTSCRGGVELESGSHTRQDRHPWVGERA